MKRDYAVARRRMVREQLADEGITDPRVLRVMGEVPRHLFVPRMLRHRAYESCALPIGYDQTISQPFMVGLMTALLELGGSEKVLEIGAGSGYQAAILGELCTEVHTVERVVPLARRADTILEELGHANVTVHAADGTDGLSAEAPFDAAMITAGAPGVPSSLVSQVIDGGLLVIPVTAAAGHQVLYRYRRRGAELEIQESVPCRFVPLLSGVEESGDA